MKKKKKITASYDYERALCSQNIVLLGKIVIIRRLFNGCSKFKLYLPILITSNQAYFIECGGKDLISLGIS